MPATREWMALLGFVLLCLAAMALGGWLTSQGVSQWYPTLEKPRWTPPSWLFGPVWTVLYLAMGVAAWLVWREQGRTAIVWPMALFAVQLVLNVAWSGLFFTLRSPLAGLVDIGLLWTAILATLIAFWRVTPAAGLLLTPYLLWVSYAAALNWALWRLNG